MAREALVLCRLIRLWGCQAFQVGEGVCYLRKWRILHLCQKCVTQMSATLSTPQNLQGRVTAKQIAKYYSTTAATIYKWAKDGSIPSIRFQGTIRFDFEAVRAAIEGSEVKG